MYRQNGRRFSRGGLPFSFWTFSKLVIHTSEKFPFTGASRFCCSSPFGAHDTLSFAARAAAGHVLSLYEERTQRRTKERNPRFPSLAPPLLRLFVRKKEMLPLCCTPISLWIASAFALQKLIRKICMIPSFIFVDKLSCIKPHCRKGVT